MKSLAPLMLMCAITFCGVGCGDDGVSSDEEARQAYLGLDASIDRALKLGFKGFNEASSANIDAQSEAGAAQGMMVVTGTVDQGASDNKGMRLNVALTDYSDGETPDEFTVVYNQTAAPLDLELSMKGLPNADLTGGLTGTLNMSGDLEGVVTLALSITGETEDAGGVVQRKAGTVRVVGTATSDSGTFSVDVTR